MVRTALGRYALLTVALAAFVTHPSVTRANEDGTESSIPIRFVVVTTFDTGDDTGTAPGEFNTWVANFPLPSILPFPQGYHHLRYNPAKQVLGIETGEGPTHMAASITALANDRRFDFSHAYWILAGIAGIDPNVGPAGSAAWASYVIDGDLAYEIDAREITVRLEHGLCSARTLIPLSTAGAACELDQRRKPVPAQRALRQLGLSVQPCQRCTSGYQQSADPPRTVQDVSGHPISTAGAEG